MKNSAADCLTHGACSDRGPRPQNEDSVLLDADTGLFVVADGVGGEQRGQVASRLVCETVLQSVRRRRPLATAVRDAHIAVALLAQRRGWRRMASTVAAVRFDGQRYDLAWVGDSRVYLWDGELKLLTRDHSYVQNLVDSQKVAFDDAQVHPGSHVITQALGAGQAKLRVGTNAGALSAGARLLICSDGVSGPVDPATLQEALASSWPAAQIAQTLISSAVQAGGQDNASCIVVQGFGEPAAAPLDGPVVYQRFEGDHWVAEAADVDDPQSVTMRLPAIDSVGKRALWWWLAPLAVLGAVWLALMA